jgi:multidrug resistance efflux pump
LNARDSRIEKLHLDLADERHRYEGLASVVLLSPVHGRVWEVLISPGEEVRRGQDLVRLVDCSAVIVTATVREPVFNQLHIGDKALFRLSGQSDSYEGEVIRMSGGATPSDNLAIQSVISVTDLHKVAVSIPGLASGECGIARTGRLVFTPNSASEPTAISRSTGSLRRP